MGDSIPALTSVPVGTDLAMHAPTVWQCGRNVLSLTRFETCPVKELHLTVAPNLMLLTDATSAKWSWYLAYPSLISRPPLLLPGHPTGWLPTCKLEQFLVLHVRLLRVHRAGIFAGQQAADRCLSTPKYWKTTCQTNTIARLLYNASAPISTLPPRATESSS